MNGLRAVSGLTAVRMPALARGVRFLSIAAVAVVVAGHPTPAAAQATPPGVRVSTLERQLLVEPRAAVLYLDLAQEHAAWGRADRAEAALRQGIDRGALPARLLPLALADVLASQARWMDALDVLAPLRADSLAVAQSAKIRVNAGLDAYRGGDRETARRQWERALTEDPALLEAAVNLGTLLVEASELDAARGVADRALRRHPGDARLQALRAATLSGREGLEAATAALRRLRADRPRDQTVGLELAQLLAASDNRAGAIALYDTLMAGPAPGVRTFIGAADLHLDVARLDEAKAALGRGLEWYPASSELWMLLGEAEGSRGEWVAAVRAYGKAVPLTNPPERAELRLVEAHAQAGDTVGALEVLETMAERRAPPEALLEVGRQASRLGSASLADRAYAVLLTADSLNLQALEPAVLVAEQLGDPERALLLASRAAAMDEAGPDPYLALLRLGSPAPDTAKLYLRRAVWRGIDRLQSEEIQAAALAQAARSPRNVSRAGPVFARREASAATVREVLDTVVFRTDWGEEELSRLRGAYPRSRLLDRYAADLAAERGRSGEAVALYDHLLTQTPADGEMQRARAATLERSGQLEQAKAAWTRALELGPENGDAFRALVRIHQSDATLPRLLAQVRRLQVRLPDSPILVEHEIEVLQRLGRVAEAQAVAVKARGGSAV